MLRFADSLSDPIILDGEINESISQSLLMHSVYCWRITVRICVERINISTKRRIEDGNVLPTFGFKLIIEHLTAAISI